MYLGVPWTVRPSGIKKNTWYIEGPDGSIVFIVDDEDVARHIVKLHNQSLGRDV